MRLLSATARASLAPDEQRRFEPDEHTHLSLEFEDGGPALYFRDVRKFGKVQWLAPGTSDERLDRLGPDALEVTGELLFGATRKRRTPIKAVLLAQDVVAGIGNIYADEALFHARVRPGRRAARVTRRECDAIADALVRVLERSIETGDRVSATMWRPTAATGRTRTNVASTRGRGFRAMRAALPSSDASSRSAARTTVRSVSTEPMIRRSDAESG